MASRTIYSPAFLITRRAIASVFKITLFSELGADLEHLALLKDKSKKNVRKRRHRAGWQVALRKRVPSQLPVPNLLSLNARSIIKKSPELDRLIATKEYSNVCGVMVQESWLTEDTDSRLISLEGFADYRCDRASASKIRGGGVVTYVRESWCRKNRVVFRYSSDSINCIVLFCKPRFLSNFSGVLLINLYIAPSCPPSELISFVDAISVGVNDFINTSLVLLGGDLNRVNLSFLYQLGLYNIVPFSTRLDACLDYVFVNHMECFTVRKRAPLSSSDHCIVHILPKVYSSLNRRCYLHSTYRRVRRRCLSPDNILALRTMLEETDFSLFADDDAETYCSTLMSYLNFCFEVCCPLETIFVRLDRFSSPLLKCLRRRKEAAYKSGRWEEVKRLSTEIRTEIRRLDALYASSLLNSAGSKDLWRVLQTLLGRKRTPNYCNLDLNKLNSSFVCKSTGQSLWLPTPAKVMSCYHPFSTLEVENILRTSKPGKSCGPGDVDPLVLKECAAIIAKPLTRLFNMLLVQGKLPDDWRIIRITPVPKSSNQSSQIPTKFRPIATTPIFLRVLEKMILSRIKPLFSSSSDPFQFAYKPNRSTLDSLASLEHSVLSSLDGKSKLIRCCFLDFCSAFNSIDRQTLLSKLCDSGVDSTILAWFQDYFTGRRQYITCGGRQSKLIANDCGVLQGAVLSPFLFSIYIDDLCSGDGNFLFKYADDLIFGRACLNDADCLSFKHCADRLFTLTSQRGLILNTTKTSEVVFSLRPSSVSALSDLHSLYVNGESLNRVPSIKYLGVLLSSTFSWSEYCNSVFAKIRRIAFFIRKLRYFKVSPKILQNFLTSCALPHILYCSPAVFPGLLKKDLQTLRRCIALLAKSSGSCFRDLIDTVIRMHFTACERFAGRIISDTSHPLNKPLCNCIPKRSTRNRFNLLYARTSAYRNSVLPYLARLLNNPEVLADELRAFFCN